MKKKILLLGLSALLPLASFAISNWNHADAAKADGEITDPKAIVMGGSWTQTTEGDDTVFTNAGGGEIYYDEPTTDNAFEVQIRHNTFLYDRNINLNVLINSDAYVLDMRHDDDAKALRFRINGGFNLYNYQVNYQATDWITFKLVFFDDVILSYLDNELRYVYPTTINSSELKQLSLSSWEIPASFKNPKHYHVNHPENTLPASLFTGTIGTALVGEKYMHMLNGNFGTHPYVGDAFNSIEYDLFIGDWTGDKNIGLYFTNGSTEYGFRFDGNGTYILNNTRGITLASGAAVPNNTFCHIKHIMDNSLLATYIDDVLVDSYETELTGSFTDIHYWDFNTLAYIGYFNPTHEHNYVHHDLVNATCTQDGMMEHYTCSCGKYFNTSKEEVTRESLVISSSGGAHDIDDTVWASNASGHYHPCSRCDGYEELFPHEGEWNVIKQPTKDEKGQKERTCTVCEYHEVVDIEKLPEDYEFNPSEWVRTTEGGKDVYTSVRENCGAGSSIYIDRNGSGNGFKAKIRANAEAVDRNVAIHIGTSTHDYMFDYRQDVDCFRFRIDGGYTAYDKTKYFELGTWFEMKMVISTGNAKCYVNNELFYDFYDASIALDEKNMFHVSSWDTNSSMMEPEIFTVSQSVLELQLVTKPTKLVYVYGDALDLSGLVVNKIMALGAPVVASVDEFTITGYNPLTIGEQTVRLSIDDKYVEFKVIVNDKVLSISITSPATKTTYNYGEELELSGLVVTAHTAAGVDKEVSPLDYEVSGYNRLQLGEQTVTITYGEKTATYKVTVVDVVSEVTYTDPVKLTYKYGENFDATGFGVKLVYATGIEETLHEDIVVTGYNANKLGERTVTVGMGGYTKDYKVTVNDYIKEIIVASKPTKTEYKVGEQLDLTGLVVKAKNASGSEADIDVSKINVSGFDSSKVGTITLKLTYEGLEATVELVIKAASSGCNGVVATLSPIIFIAACGCLLIALLRKKRIQ